MCQSLWRRRQRRGFHFSFSVRLESWKGVTGTGMTGHAAQRPDGSFWRFNRTATVLASACTEAKEMPPLALESGVWASARSREPRPRVLRHETSRSPLGLTRRAAIRRGDQRRRHFLPSSSHSLALPCPALPYPCPDSRPVPGGSLRRYTTFNVLLWEQERSR